MEVELVVGYNVEYVWDVIFNSLLLVEVNVLGFWGFILIEIRGGFLLIFKYFILGKLKKVSV